MTMFSKSAAVLALAALAQGQVTVTGPLNPVINSGFGTPSSGTTSTFMYDTALAWVDLDGAVFKLVPEEVRGIPTDVPSAQLLAGSTVRFDCPAQVGTECHAWVWYYVCPAKNCVGKYQGGVPQLLAGTAGWEFTLCAPSFQTGTPSKYIHQMRGYRYQLPAGTSTEFVTPDTAEFLAFGLENAPADCSVYSTPIACETATTSGRCLWNAAESKCVDTTCKRGGQGPPPPCLECPWEGLEARPAADGP